MIDKPTILPSHGSLKRVKNWRAWAAIIAYIVFLRLIALFLLIESVVGLRCSSQQGTKDFI